MNETFGAPADAFAMPERAASFSIGRLLAGILLGVLVAAVTGILWFGADILIDNLFRSGDTVSTRVIVFSFVLAGLMGWVIALSIMKGTRRGGLIIALISVLLTLVALFFSDYFLDRYYGIQALIESGNSAANKMALIEFLPLQEMIQIVREGLEAAPIYAGFYGTALLIAFLTPITQRRRILGPRQ